ncbi:MAG: BON domain-containing protein [Xanthomonadales bacterium]|nr:BON domain-containing protein [Xanthomonadales bacterium]
MNKRRKFILGVLAVMGLAGILGQVVPTGTAAADSECTQDVAASDTRIATRLEAAYLINPHLNNISIDTEVTNGDVLLSGTVRSAIDRDLAEEIARSLDEVKSVRNSLEIREDLETASLSASDSGFLQKVKDATTTAQVKTRLISNENIPARDIDVDTKNNVVRLSGEVGSDTERQLAEFIAKNTAGVQSVSNQLEIRRSG